MKARLIKTDAEYQAALAHIESLMDATKGSRKEDELELWALLVERYEQQNFPIGSPDPIEAIKFRMDQLGLQQKDLTAYIPAKSKISEVLNHKRPLSLTMIRQLHEHLGIPADVLVQESPLSAYRTGTAKGKKSMKATSDAKSTKRETDS